jgi:hypothetical protein
VTIPPRRNLPLRVLSCVVLGWVLALLVDLGLHPRDFLPPLALGSTAIGSVALPVGWLLREQRQAIREKRARQRFRYLPVEVIPIKRFEKPPGYDWWKARNRVVTVGIRRIRLVPPISPRLARRKALGLGAQWPQAGNHRQKRGWYRRLVWQ